MENAIVIDMIREFDVISNQVKLHQNDIQMI